MCKVTFSENQKLSVVKLSLIVAGIYRIISSAYKIIYIREILTIKILYVCMKHVRLERLASSPTFVCFKRQSWGIWTLYQNIKILPEAEMVMEFWSAQYVHTMRSRLQVGFLKPSDPQAHELYNQNVSTEHVWNTDTYMHKFVTSRRLNIL